MIVPEHVVCNVCGTEKMTTNHWYVARISAGDPSGIAFLPIADPEAHLPMAGIDLEHICGQQCAHKRLSQWLENFK